MKLRVVDKHDGEGHFPLFAKGANVDELVACEQTAHWFVCVIEGYKTYIPDTYVTDGVLVRDYNPTELVLEAGQIVTLMEVAFEWLYVEDQSGKRGWFPAEKAVSV